MLLFQPQGFDDRCPHVTFFIVAASHVALLRQPQRRLLYIFGHHGQLRRSCSTAYRLYFADNADAPISRCGASMINLTHIHI